MKVLGRFIINIVLGLGGFFDVVLKMGMLKFYEDFGLIFVYYGVGRGFYLVLLILGFIYLRDVFGVGVDSVVVGKLDIYKRMYLFDFVLVNYIDVSLFVLKGIDLRKNINFYYY